MALPYTEKKWTIEAAIESIQMLDLADKDFKVASLNMFLKTKKILKEKGMLTASHQKIENIYKGVELILKRN